MHPSGLLGGGGVADSFPQLLLVSWPPSFVGLNGLSS